LWWFLVCHVFLRVTMTLSLLTMSYVDKKIDHLFVSNTILFAWDKRRRFRSIAVQGENNRLFCPASMTSLWHVRKRKIKRNTLISGEIHLLINRWHCKQR
jgi:hypothetical protein